MAFLKIFENCFIVYYSQLFSEVAFPLDLVCPMRIALINILCCTCVFWLTLFLSHQTFSFLASFCFLKLNCSLKFRLQSCAMVMIPCPLLGMGVIVEMQQVGYRFSSTWIFEKIKNKAAMQCKALLVSLVTSQFKKKEKISILVIGQK